MQLFDIYEGAQINAVIVHCYTCIFRAQDKTLEDADIQNAMNKILKKLEELGIELRK